MYPGRPRKWKNAKNYCLYLPTELMDKVDELVARYGISRSDIIVEALAQYLETATEELEAKREETEREGKKEEDDELDRLFAQAFSIQIENNIREIEHLLHMAGRKIEKSKTEKYNKKQHINSAYRILANAAGYLKDVYRDLKKYQQILPPHLKDDFKDLLEKYRELAQELESL